MTTERLYEFLVLSRALNFSLAAKVLYISQSILSRHIQDLEAELNTILFVRSTHSVSLTEAGKILAQQVPSLLTQCDNTLELLRLKNLSTVGAIKILCELELSTSDFICDFIRSFRKRYENIELSLDVKTENTPPEIMSECDFLFTPCLFTNLPPYIHSSQIQEFGTYLLVSKTHPLSQQPFIRLHQLSGETLIVPYADEPFGPYMQNWLLAARETHGQLTCEKVKNLSTAIFRASVGKGGIIVPKHVKNMISANTMSMVSIIDPNCRFNEYVYYNSLSESSAAKLFYEDFRKYFGQ